MARHAAQNTDVSASWVVLVGTFQSRSSYGDVSTKSPYFDINLPCALLFYKFDSSIIIPLVLVSLKTQTLSWILGRKWDGRVYLEQLFMSPLVRKGCWTMEAVQCYNTSKPF